MVVPTFVAMFMENINEMINIKDIAKTYQTTPDAVFNVLLSYGNKVNQKLLAQKDGETYIPEWLWDEMNRIDSGIDSHVISGMVVRKHMQTVESISAPSVYFLYRGDDLVYIGQSHDVFSRISIHLKDENKIFDKFAILPIANHELQDVEYSNIRHYKPEYNQQGKSDTDYRMQYILRKCHIEGLADEDWD